ncbi:MAG: hypothetical protein NVSMB18_19460 [Acetobacteraceae bacterium]
MSTLYWSQALVPRVIEEFGPTPAVLLLPGATLLGYALGVAGLATVARDLTDPRGLAWHFLLLAAALCAAASAPAAIVLTVAGLVTGIGCALTQRLLAIATSAVAPGERAQTIGWIIAGGLSGIVLARACGPAAAAWVGWRGVFWCDAAAVSLAALAASAAAFRGQGRPAFGPTGPLPAATSLWRREPSLRHSALQQALVFAAFNMGWAVFPRFVQGVGPSPGLYMGLVATVGAASALLSGRLCGRSEASMVARAGLRIVLIGATILSLGHAVPAFCYLGMGLLDAGTQVALVANQARAQASASSPAMRGRLAAIVTTIGFAGGAVGATIGNLCLRLVN